MRNFVLFVMRQVLLAIGRLLARILLKVHIEGLAHLPPRAEPLILIANHFSWFDPPVLALILPCPPSFLAAIDIAAPWWVALIMRVFDCIPVWRGRADRKAIRATVDALQAGKTVAIFPEGGINPHWASRAIGDATAVDVASDFNRLKPELIPGRAGAALIAVSSQARIVPMALLGVDAFWENVRRLRRTSILLRIGPVIGPYTIEPGVTGQARRRCLDTLTDEMMRSIADLLPPENRGYYR